jgi:hypothetical protein
MDCVMEMFSIRIRAPLYIYWRITANLEIQLPIIIKLIYYPLLLSLALPTSVVHHISRRDLTVFYVILPIIEQLCCASHLRSSHEVFRCLSDKNNKRLIGLTNLLVGLAVIERSCCVSGPLGMLAFTSV